METIFAAIFQQLKTDFTLPQKSNTEEAQDNTEGTQNNIEETKNLLEKLISGIFQVVFRLTGWVDASFGDIYFQERDYISLRT